MMRKLVIGALLFCTSVCHAVTIGAPQGAPQRTQQKVVKQHSAQPKVAEQGIPSKKVVKTIKRKKVMAPEKGVQVKHHHHYHHYYHYPEGHREYRPRRRQMVYHHYRQPVRVVQSYRTFAPRGFYPAPAPGIGLHYVIR
jgi:hypothetical protein